MARKSKPIVQWDIDEARYVGDGTDGVYYLAGKGRKGWYVTTVVDSDTGSFVQDLVTDDGPYATEAEAWEAGKNGATDWCLDNHVSTEEEE